MASPSPTQINHSCDVLGRIAGESLTFAPAPGGADLEILAVVQDRSKIEPLIRKVEQARYAVHLDFARSKNEYLIRVRAKNYDLILADTAHGTWTALDLLRSVAEAAPDVPVIVLGDHTDVDRGFEYVTAGASDFLESHEANRLPISVAKALSDRHTRREKRVADELIRKLTMAVDQSPASIVFTDVSGTIQYVNQRFTEVSGYTVAEAIGATPRILHSGRNSRETYAQMWKTIKSGAVWRGELQNQKKNGQLYWDSVSISPIRDADGVVTHFLACQEDVTERKRTDQKIRESEERFRQLVENMQEVFFVASASLREMQYISPAYEHVWGRTVQSLYENPQSFIDAVPDSDRERVFAFVAKLQACEAPAPIEYPVQHPDGSVRWVLVHAAPIRDADGKVYRLSGSALDVTERRNAEIALKESETRFRLLTEASFDGIDIVVDGIIVDANQGLAAMLGYSVDELIGRRVVDFVDAESRELVSSRMREGLSGVYEFVGLHKTGRKMVLEAAAKTHVVDGKSARLTAVRDITEKRNLENQFRQAQKMEAVGRLAGGVAHDFNNLLTVIMTYSQMLADEFAADDPRRDDLEQIRKASTAAASLTRQLLAFSRQQVIEPKLVSLNDIVSGAHKMLGRLIGEDITLNSALTSDSCNVMIDPGQLEQVIMNLAVNARDAMPRGGKLTLETAIVDLDQNYADSHWPAVAGRYAMLAVADNGLGMTAEVRARIFEPFFTTKEVGKGTGLGLATVYGIVKQSNGFIWVYSEPGMGTTFKLYFPIAAVMEKQDDAVARTAALRRGKETILLVEDSPAVRAAAQRILQQCGYRVLEATSGKAALALAAKREPIIDLLITDVVMPEMGGREVADHFTRLRPAAKVMFMSGYTDDAVIRHGVLRPGIAYLQKPFTGEALAEKVRMTLDGLPEQSSAESLAK